MALATLYTHFGYDPIVIPNRVPSTTTVENAEATKLQAFIAKYEPQFVKAILGQELYDLYIEGIDAETAIYESIRDGGTYDDVYGVVQKWEGFTAGMNPIANYIYWYYQKSNASSTTGVGETNASVENGTRTSPNQKMVEAWSEMVDMNRKLHGYLYANREDYPTWIGLTYLPDSMPNFTELFTKQNFYGI